MSEWISVKDRLPDRTCKCLLIMYRTIELGYYNAKEKRFEIPNDCAFDGWPIPVDGVTHWMPLPEPPVKGK